MTTSYDACYQAQVAEDETAEMERRRAAALAAIAVVRQLIEAREHQLKAKLALERAQQLLQVMATPKNPMGIFTDPPPTD